VPSIGDSTVCEAAIEPALAFLLCDGAVQFILATFGPTLFRGLSARAGNGDVSVFDAKGGGLRQIRERIK